MRCTCSAQLERDATFCGICGRRVDGDGRPKRPSLIGLVLDGRFRVEAKIANGGFATLYRATHVATGCDVALKVLHPEHAANPAISMRFRRESAALASLRDPHTVATYEAGETSNGTLYIAMELLRGESLEARFATRGAMPWRQALLAARAVCSSLAEAHASGIVHRDLKPANIHLEQHAGEPDFVKVLDFGVAKVSRASGIHDGNELTQAGEAIGTIDYMAPEQLVGGDCDARTDIYALGVVMYEMITGRRPFADATGPASLMTACLTRSPVPPSVACTWDTFPPEIDRVILRCLQSDPRYRFGDMRELADAIDRAFAGPALIQPTRRLWMPPGPGPATLSADGDATWIDQTPTGLDPAHLDPALAWQPAPSLQSSVEPLPAFDVGVAGTDVGPRPGPVPLRARRIVAWSLALLAAGFGVGALLAAL